ncbi:blastula protease 10-like isoform X2 [Nematostella vectensis]|nr:blastula protease 10-like isoform X2 [Nematostella vectensis]
MEGLVRESSVNRSFCIKNQRDDDATTTRPIWPDGKYCIYQSDLSCPTGLRAGSVTWGDEETNNLNSKGGVLPKGSYNDGVDPPITALQFCCSVMGDPSVPLSLPVDSPFYLMPYGSKECQQVEWAVGELEWIYFDSNGIHNEVRAPYPYGANVVGHTIHYCYYTSCKYNLMDSTGTFQSPRFPQKYPDGQLCSWRIIVNPGHVVNVHFTNFSLTGGSSSDVLKLFDGGSDRAKLMTSLYGNVIPGDVRSTSNELFAVFSSDNAWSGGGFRAEYKAVDPVEVQTATSSSPTTSEIASPTTPTTTKVVATDVPTTSLEITTEVYTTANKQASAAPQKNCAEGSERVSLVAILVPLVCLVGTIGVAGFLLYRWRNQGKAKPSVTVEYHSGCVQNPAYERNSIITMQDPEEESVAHNKLPPPASDLFNHSEEIYQEMDKETDNPLYETSAVEDAATKNIIYDALD